MNLASKNNYSDYLILNPKIILQIKHIFIKYLGVNSVAIIDSYVQQGLPYKKMLQEGYSLIDDDMKKELVNLLM